MFDGFLKSKFQTKSKSALKLTKIRIEGIQRKRNAMQKYLKNDISDLLKNGFDLNAYGRADGLIVEMNKSAVYDLIDQFCKVISEQLSVMNKQKECPDECKEAVASLMFAAARFADLPELRELRTIFADRYGKSLDTHVSQEFVEKLKANAPTKDVRLKLLQDISTEYGLEWDTKSLENQIFTPPTIEQGGFKKADHREIEIKKDRTRPVREIDKQDFASNDTPKMNEKHKIQSNREKEASDDDKCEPRDIQIDANINTTIENITEEKANEKKPVSYKLIPPPYTKSKSNDLKTGSSENEPVNEAESKPRSVRRRQLKPRNEGTGLKVVTEDDKKENKTGCHSRAMSLPEEIIPSETKKGHARAFSFQPDTECNHPKLLDYDDFVARLAALRQQ